MTIIMETNTPKFVYMLIRETNSEKQLDNTIRIVHWPDDSGINGYYVIYGQRSNLNNQQYIPYRLSLNTITDTLEYLKYVLNIDTELQIELHQFAGEIEDENDKYNIAWKNTNEDASTELVAYDCDNCFHSAKIIRDGLSFLKICCIQ